MCSFASCRKGKHMCARSVVNKLLCGIHQWPDVMDKRQTNALTPLLDQLRRKERTGKCLECHGGGNIYVDI